MSAKPKWTREQLLAAIHQALKDEDMAAVAALLYPLAAVAPNDAQAICDLVDLMVNGAGRSIS